MLHVLLTTVLAWTCVSAFAQWQWIDNEGRKVFSDRPPPSEVLDKNILKRPSARPATTDAAAASTSPDSPTAGAEGSQKSDPKTAGLDKELEAKKKQAAEAEAAKRKAEEERITKAKVESCARAKQAKTTLDAGIRLVRSNAAGEQEYLDDAARAAEAKRIQGIIATDCR